MRTTSQQLFETNARITKAAYATARGTLPLPDASGLCLAAVRLVVEHALFGGQRRYYDWRTLPVERSPVAPPSAHEPVARDMERRLKQVSMAVQLEQQDRFQLPDNTLIPGDLLS